jgi:adenylosuccinate synthase
MDEAREAKRGAVRIGTTHRGIGPTYSDKFARAGIRMGDLLDERAFVAKVRRNLEEKNHFFRSYYGVPEVDEEEIMAQYRAYIPRIRPAITDTISLLGEAVAAGRRILLEGAQGTMLDADFGTYPFVTASSASAGGACTGTGIPPTAIAVCVGVAKAYTTRVGAGPLPTELPPQDDERLRILGREYGATTGRPRRCGWFDAVAVRRSAVVNGLTGLAVTKLDVLDQLEVIRVCVAYRIGDRETAAFPNRIEEVERAVPVYRDFPGWRSSTAEVRAWRDLPSKARDYLEALENLTGTRLSLVSVGPERRATIPVGDKT